MKNNYELVIKIEGSNSSKKTISDPFKEKDKEENKKLDNFIKGATKSIIANSTMSIVKGYTQTMGNSHLNDQIDFAKSSLDSVIRVGTLTATFGGAGLAVGLLMMLPEIIGQTIAYSNGTTWDRISQNKGLRRAGPEFNRSRF